MPDDDAARELLLKQITKQLDALKDMPADIALLSAQVSEMKQCVEQNNRTLRGRNGDPGVADQIRSIAKSQSTDHAKVTELEKSVNGDPKDHESTGLKGDVRDLRQEIDKYRRYQYFFLTAVFGLLLTLVFQHVIQ